MMPRAHSGRRHPFLGIIVIGVVIHPYFIAWSHRSRSPQTLTLKMVRWWPRSRSTHSRSLIAATRERRERSFLSYRSNCKAPPPNRGEIVGQCRVCTRSVRALSGFRGWTTRWCGL